MFDIEHLKEFHETEKLVAVLRFAGGQPERRAAAARALGDLDNMEVIEILICAHLGDPEAQVQEAAYQALFNLLSGDVDLAISAYKIEPGELDDWLIEAENELGLFSVLGYKAEPGMGFHDLDEADGSPKESASSLVKTLRFAGNSAETRAQAARDLGKLYRTDLTESLMRSYLEDTDQVVRDAAHHALDDLYGNRLDMIIDSYRESMPYDEPWMIDEEDAVAYYNDLLEHQIIGEVPGMPPFDDIEFDGLISILRSDSPTELRVKAVELLQYSTDARAIEWLLKVALEEDVEQVRTAAEQTLKDIFPGDADQMLREFHVEEEVEIDRGWTPVDEHEVAAESRSQLLIDSQPPAVTREKDILPIIILALVVVFVIIVAFIIINRG